MATKQCSKCKQTKPVEAFYHNKGTRDGRAYRCRDCCLLRHHEFCAKIKHTEVHAKHCSTCNTLLPISEFNPERSSRDGHRKICRMCRRFETLLHKYSMSRAAYEDRIEQQHGKCAICKQPEIRKLRGNLAWLCVDHDHATGHIRGLLCHACNKAVGIMQDDPIRLRAAAAYLETA